MRNGIVVAVVGGLILAGILQLSGNLGGLFAKVVSWAWSSVSWIWAMLQSSHPMPGWAILVVGLLALFGLIIVIGNLFKEFLHGKPEPAFRNYTEDMLDGVRWRWGWRGNQIANTLCFCPICDAQLVYAAGFGETDFICERCPSDGTLHSTGSRGRVVATVRGGDRNYAVAAAEREILRRIRTGAR